MVGKETKKIAHLIIKKTSLPAACFIFPSTLLPSRLIEFTAEEANLLPTERADWNT